MAAYPRENVKLDRVLGKIARAHQFEPQLFPESLANPKSIFGKRLPHQGVQVVT
jgi:hypothetical protein